ncbi:protein unc-13 homolog [Impatiens glandulifera]|uniref:protein unc-13 homolog n=1 Tax=Impatiens glandulifera TaxID=253017 RepID=UPI001FB0D32B|nr:protein unc-13 homolog [Impatiens glandulifera]
MVNDNITSDVVVKLANETEEIALKEKAIFSPVMKKWHPIASGSAAVSLHSCYGKVLKQYVTGIPFLTPDTLMGLQRAGRLEKLLIQMVVEDSVDSQDEENGKAVVREMVPYEIDAIITDLLNEWIQDRMNKGKNCIHIAKETESWNPISKNEAYAESAMELMKVAKEAIEDFFELPLAISEDLLLNFAKELNILFADYVSFLASCGSKQSYLPNLPPLTRCGSDSKIASFFKKASSFPSPSNDMVIPCELSVYTTEDGHQIQTSSSRGTQRLYIRLNTLHYLLNQIQSLDKSLSLSSSYFEPVESSIKSAIHQVSEVAAYRLVFLDSGSVLHDTLYTGNVATSRIKPALKTLKMNLSLLRLIVTDQAQKTAVKHMMKASFEAFLMVLVAGGSSRVFKRQDHVMIKEDLDALKKIFGEDNVERESSEAVEGVVELMGETTEQLVEDFSIIACESGSVNGAVGARYGQKLSMPATTGKWNRSDSNTIVRILCHRKDSAANSFLKRTFQLARRV